MPDLDYLQNCLGQRGIPEAYTFLLGKTKNVVSYLALNFQRLSNNHNNDSLINDNVSWPVESEVRIYSLERET